MITLTLCGDHGVWDGRSAARFLAAVQAELEKP
jgi:pyruvate/2-oxoglutarate dehydrogenase complex dihydrolipoamide acyltransferase (E2) component